MESAAKIVSTRKVVEHAVMFQLKPDVTEKAKQDIVEGIWSLKERCSQWVKAASVGYVLNPDLAKGASIGLFMRFFSKEALDEYFDSGPKTQVTVDLMLPYLTGEITLDFEAEVTDDRDSVFREGEAFENGVERIVAIKVKEGTSQDAVDEMVKALNGLNEVPELSSLLVQLTAGANFCTRGDRYTVGLVARCPSVEDLAVYSKHPSHIDVLSKKVWPITEATLTSDYVVGQTGGRTSLL